MAVGIERERHRAVAEEVLDELRMSAGLQQYGRGRMTEIVDANSWQPGA